MPSIICEASANASAIRCRSTNGWRRDAVQCGPTARCWRSSETSIEDAIKNAVSRASKTIRDMKWFEVVQTRGHIENGTVRHYQVTLRVGFTLEG